MKKQLFIALACAASMMFAACNQLGGNGGNGADGEKSMQKKWITSPSQVKDYEPETKVNECWEYKVWCDGVTIATEYFWGPESAVIFMINASMKAEYKNFGEYHKKYWYQQVEEPTEAACTSRQWEGAECLLETVSWEDENGNHQSQSEYFWIPEDSMKVRHEYYMNVTKAAEEASGKKFNFEHSYAKSEFEDADACRGQNEGDDQTVVIVDPNEPQTVDYSKFDNTTSKCWKVTQDKYTITITNYVWMTERDLVQQFDAIGINYHYELADAADEDACNELDENTDPVDLGEEACYRITITVPAAGVTVVQYAWAAENVLPSIIADLKSTYEQMDIGEVSVTYTKSSETTEESCEARND